MPQSRTSRLTRLTRGCRLVMKLLEGLFLIGAVLPHLRSADRDMIIQRWCLETLDILAIRLKLRGETPPGRVSSVLFVANHVSWVDILVINTCRRVRFVARAEVRQYPLLGWMAARTGTLFVTRTSPRDVARVAKGVSASLRRGHCVALLREGTTNDDTSRQAFHSELLASAIEAEALVWPLAITYKRPDGSRDADNVVAGNQSLLSSIMNVLARPATQVQLSFSAPVESSTSNCRELTVWCQRAIERSLVSHPQLSIPGQSPVKFPPDEYVPPLTAA
ncbi:lysophospholipid acyltransferase family protein [Nitrospira sp. NS4]|uniref:lysophospholipid acyltransferase family protein n=1 Tax=Nitrospira sp. NS4 TaxID=3414498 RepID=UPI003C300E78